MNLICFDFLFHDLNSDGERDCKGMLIFYDFFTNKIIKFNFFFIDGSDEPSSCPVRHCRAGTFQCGNTNCTPSATIWYVDNSFKKKT